MPVVREVRAEWFVRLPPNGFEYRGSLIPPGDVDDFEPFDDTEPHWSQAGAAVPDWVVPPGERVVEGAVGSEAAGARGEESRE